MFSRVLFYSTNLTEVCCRPLLQQKQKAFGQFRSSFHNSKRNVRRPVLEPEPLDAIPLDSGPLYARSLYKPFAFAIGVSAASIVGCAIWEYERVRSHATQFLRRPGQWFGTHQKKLMTQFQAKNEAGSIKKLWSSLRDSEKVFYPILLANVLVFGAWRVRSLQPVMIKYFCSNPSGTAKCIPMILSTFSHYSPLHLAANMYVLYSFMPAAVASLGKEQFTAMYLSGGVFSSFCSFLYKVAFNQPGLSLGASGAIMAVLSYVCVQYPETKLNIIFLPMYTFAAGTAIKAIMSVDLAGVVLGWKVFDHAAHLGGALFGIAWCHWGSSEIWAHRDKILQYYHALRKPDSR